MRESKLVALTCSVAERRERMAGTIADLAARADPDRLWDVMESHQLTALAGSRLMGQGVLPPSLEERVSERLKGNRARALYHSWAVTRVITGLEEAGIPTLPLKGVTLAEDVHADPGLRTSGDIDVLVPAPDLHRAGEALRPFGYLPIEEGPGARPDLHTVLVDLNGKLPPAEVHWRVHWFEEAFSQQMLNGARRHGSRLRAQPTEELAALLLFFARDGFLGLRLAADLAAWWDTCGPDLPPQALDRLAAAHPALTPVWSTALRVAERVVGLPSQQIMSLPAEGLRQHVAGRMANWAAAGPRDQRSADVSLVNLLLSPRRRLSAMARRYVFPDRAGLDHFYGLGDDDGLLRAAWRVAHPPKMFARYGLGLLRSRDHLSSDPLAMQAHGPGGQMAR